MMVTLEGTRKQGLAAHFSLLSLQLRSVEDNKQCPDQNLLLLIELPWNDIDHGWLFFFCIQFVVLVKATCFSSPCSYRARTMLGEAHTKETRAT